MNTLKKVYKFDENGFYEKSVQAQYDPLHPTVLLTPPDCVTFAPDADKLKTSWAVLNSDGTEWSYKAKPTTASECVGFAVKHSDQTSYAIEMRQLMTELCKKDDKHFRIARDESLTLTVEAIPEKTLEELITAKHQELKGVMSNKRQELKVSYDNDTFDANEDAQANMIVLLKSFDLGAKSVSIRSTTEQTHIFNQSQAQELSMLMLGAVDSLYKEYWDFKDKLYQCTTVEEVNAISWS